jgi:hypothetical protein
MGKRPGEVVRGGHGRKGGGREMEEMLEPTENENEHACVASVRVGTCNADEIADDDGNAAGHDDKATLLVPVGNIDDGNERRSPNNVDRDGHVVDTEGGIPGGDSGQFL